MRKQTSRKRIADWHQVLRKEEQQFRLSCPNADPVSRMSAFILDAIFLFLAFSTIQHICDNFLWNPRTLVYLRDHNLQGFAPWIPLLLNWSFFLFGYLWPLVKFGGTPAKLILGLRVIDSETGQTLSPVRALIRELALKWILNFFTMGMGCLSSLFRKDNSSLHDILSRSAVKRIYFEL